MSISIRRQLHVAETRLWWYLASFLQMRGYEILRLSSSRKFAYARIRDSFWSDSHVKLVPSPQQCSISFLFNSFPVFSRSFTLDSSVPQQPQPGSTCQCFGAWGGFGAGDTTQLLCPFPGNARPCSHCFFRLSALSSATERFFTRYASGPPFLRAGISIILGRGEAI